MDLCNFTASYDVDSFGGHIIPEIINKIRNTINCRCKFSTYKLENGVALEGGNFSGMIGLLQNKVLDAAFHFFTVTHERFQTVQFTPYVKDVHQSFLVGVGPFTTENRYFNFLLSYDVYVYSFIALCFGLTTCVYYFQCYLLRDGNENLTPHFFDVLFLQWRIFLGQNVCVPIEARSLFWSLVICSVVLLSAFSGVLMSHLSVPKESRFIRSFADFLNFPQVEIFFVNGSSDRHIYQTFLKQNDLIEQLYRINSKGGQLIEKKVRTQKWFLDRVENRQIALCTKRESLIEKVLIKRFKRGESCRFRITEDYFPTFFKAFAFRMNVDSALLQDINKMILGFHSGSIRNRMSYFQNDKVERYCLRAEQEMTLKQMNFDQIIGPLCVLLIGHSIAFLKLLYERSRKTPPSTVMNSLMHEQIFESGLSLQMGSAPDETNSNFENPEMHLQ